MKRAPRAVQEKNKKNTSQLLALCIVFVVYIFVRVFVNYDTVILAADNLKYLALAHRLPSYSLFNNELYTEHPPGYPAIIRLALTLIPADYIAAIFLSLAASAIFFIYLYKFLKALSIDFPTIFFTLVLLTFSVELIMSSQSPLKESVVIMLLLVSLYFHHKSVTKKNGSALAATCLLASITALVSDHSIFLFPAFLITYFIFGSKKLPKKYVILPILFTAVFFGSWLVVKAYQYATHEYFTIGLDGAPVATKDFGISQVLDPVTFKDYDPNVIRGFTVSPKHYPYQIGYMFNMIPLSIPRGLNFTSMYFLFSFKHLLYILFLYIPLAVCAMVGLFGTIKAVLKKRKIYNNSDLYLLCLFLIFIFPITQRHASPRYIFFSYVLLYYFISKGLVALLKKIPGSLKYTMPTTLGLMIILLPLWHVAHPQIVLFSKKQVLLERTADFIKSNLDPVDGIMGQSGYPVKLAYLTKHRIMGLPPTDDNFLELIEKYNISYVFYGDYFTKTWYHYNAETVAYIQSHPKLFELVATIPEFVQIYGKNETENIYLYRVNHASR